MILWGYGIQVSFIVNCETKEEDLPDPRKEMLVFRSEVTTNFSLNAIIGRWHCKESHCNRP